MRNGWRSLPFLVRRSCFSPHPRLVLVILPFSYLTGSGLLIIWSILSWFIAFLVLVIEFPLFTRCFPEGSNLARFFKSSRYHVFRLGSQ